MGNPNPPSMPQRARFRARLSPRSHPTQAQAPTNAKSRPPQTGAWVSSFVSRATLESRSGMSGGAGRDRTDDLRLAKPALSQLSYSPKKTPNHPVELRRVVGLGRFELPTSRLSVVCSNQLSYRPAAPYLNQPPQLKTVKNINPKQVSQNQIAETHSTDHPLRGISIVSFFVKDNFP